MSIFNKKTDEKEEKKGEKSVAVVNGEKKQGMKDLYKENEGKKSETGKAESKKKKNDGNAYRILIKPLITEKAANLGVEGKYVFMAADKANKIEVSKAIEEVYGVKPVSVNVIKMQGKFVRSGKTLGRRKDWKKVIVTLPKGKTIKVYEGV